MHIVCLVVFVLGLIGWLRLMSVEVECRLLRWLIAERSKTLTQGARDCEEQVAELKTLLNTAYGLPAESPESPSRDFGAVT